MTFQNFKDVNPSKMNRILNKKRLPLDIRTLRYPAQSDTRLTTIHHSSLAKHRPLMKPVIIRHPLVTERNMV